MKSLGFVVLLAGCSFQATGQNASPDAGGSPGGPGPKMDGGVVVPPVDARLCFGTGLVKLCLDAAPSNAVTLPSATNPLDTGVDGNCQKIVKQSDNSELCVIAGTSVTVSGSFAPVGNRPLVLIGADAVTVTGAGTIDVSSKINPRHVGAGANSSQCTTPGNGKNDNGGGGGGAGGSFGTVGGNGGTGDQNNNGLPNGMAPGGMASAGQATPAVLRGGCSGSAGGDGADTDATHVGGTGGDGGGAVYLIAGNTITIDGDVFASGAGGGVTAGAAGFEQGGGGGGTGGMIGLDAPMIQVQGHVVANGGAGGGGGALNANGTAGGDGTTTKWNTRAAAGQGGPPDAGDGADGTMTGTTTNLNGRTANGGGGGGAGGLGLVWTYGNLPGTPMISPAPVKH